MNRFLFKITIRNAKTHKENNILLLWHTKRLKPSKKELVDYIYTDLGIQKYEYVLQIQTEKNENVYKANKIRYENT